MRPFKFTLQALRTLRQRQENETLEAYARELVHRARVAERLAAAEHALTAGHVAWQQKAQGGCTAAQMDQHARHCQQLAAQRDAQLAAFGEAERRVNSALNTMLAARRQREVVDKFFAKQRRAYAAAIARADQKFLDELAQRRPEFTLGGSLEPEFGL